MVDNEDEKKNIKMRKEKQDIKSRVREMFKRRKEGREGNESRVLCLMKKEKREGRLDEGKEEETQQTSRLN